MQICMTQVFAHCSLWSKTNFVVFLCKWLSKVFREGDFATFNLLRSLAVCPMVLWSRVWQSRTEQCERAGSEMGRRSASPRSHIRGKEMFSCSPQSFECQGLVLL